MNDSFAEKLASAVAHWSHHDDLASFAHDCVRFCVEISGGVLAGLSQAGRKGRLTPLRVAGRLDPTSWQEQFRLREGPSMEAFEREATVSASAIDLRHRWPRWSAATWADVRDAGAVRAFPLHHGTSIVGVLELWTDRPEDAAHLPRTLPAHVAAHFALVRRHEHLMRALTTRTVVGQAQGITMERFGLRPEPAFAVLRRISQHRNVKLADLADELVTSGSVDGLSGPAQRPGDPRPVDGSSVSAPEAAG